MSDKHIADIRAAVAKPVPTQAPERPTAVYWLYDGADTLLYVGMTNNPVQRFAEHRGDKKWWPKVAAYSIRWFDTRARAEAAEVAAILNDGPLRNIEHQPRAMRDGGLPAVPFWLAEQLHTHLIAYTAQLLPAASPLEHHRHVEHLIADLDGKVLLLFGASSPQERHPLDLDALLDALDTFGPVIAPPVLTP